MTDAAERAARARTPWHLWVVGVVSALWNAFGVYDYLCTQFQGETYLRNMGMTDAQIAHYVAYPVWMDIAWPMGVFGSLIGSILLLLRSRCAFHAFVISLIGFALNLIYNYGLTNGGAINGQVALIMSAVIGVIIVALTLYARAMGKRGVLR